MFDIYRLPPILVACHSGNNLGGDSAGHLKTLGRFYHFSVDGCTIVQHVLNMNQAAVEDGLNKIIRIVKVKHSIVMGHGKMFRQQQTSGYISGNLPRNIIPLGRRKPGIFIGIFFRKFFIFIAN